MKIFIANIPHQLQEADLKQLLTLYGQVATVKLVSDPQTGKRKGFGFVEMPQREQGQKAIDGLNGLELHGRKIAVSQAIDKETLAGNQAGKRQRSVQGGNSNYDEINGNRW